MEQMAQVAREHGKILAPLKDDLQLAECGLELAWVCRTCRPPGRQAWDRSVYRRRGRLLSCDVRRVCEGL